jgi:Macrocin-O-methyltransferase (TylF)
MIKEYVKRTIKWAFRCFGIELVRRPGSITLRHLGKTKAFGQRPDEFRNIIRWSPAPVVESSMFDKRLYDQKIILDHLKLLTHRHPEGRIVILTDIDLPRFGVPVFDCRHADFFKAFPSEEIRDSIFYCIFDSDQQASNIIGFISDAKGIFYPPPISCPVASYFHFNDTVRRVLKLELEDQSKEGFAKWDCGPGDMINLIQSIDLTQGLDGSFIEIGTYRGSSARLALRYMKEVGLRRVCYFLDVFSGFDYPEARMSADRMWVDTHSTEGQDTVAKRLSIYDNPERGLEVRVMKANIITNALPADLTKVVLANIDVDMYEAVLAALCKVAPLVVKNGIMIVEDAGHTPALIGARLALSRFLKSSQGIAFLPVYMESGQTFLIRQ